MCFRLYFGHFCSGLRRNTRVGHNYLTIYISTHLLPNPSSPSSIRNIYTAACILQQEPNKPMIHAQCKALTIVAPQQQQHVSSSELGPNANSYPTAKSCPRNIFEKKWQSAQWVCKKNQLTWCCCFSKCYFILNVYFWLWPILVTEMDTTTVSLASIE